MTNSGSIVTEKSSTTRSRSIAKTLTWRATATLDTFLISYLVTGSLSWAGSIVSIEIVTKMIMYYFHERIWSHLRWGQSSSPAENAKAAE